MIEFELNGRQVSVDAEPDTPLLWAIRDEIGLTGTKFGCGIGACRSCAVHLDGKPVTACTTRVGSAVGKQVTTIEGLASDAGEALKAAWVSEQVPQCGYCQSGQIMQAANLLERNNDPSEDDIVAHMNGHLCRCMAYPRIKRAIRIAAQRHQSHA